MSDPAASYVSLEQSRLARLRAGARRRPGTELVCELVFRPLGQLVVRALLPLGVAPTSVVVLHTLVGLAAAALLWEGQLVGAAIALQFKTLLDNSDGQLARASGRVTAVGRYLDTLCDALVNVTVFAALAHVSGQPVLALVALAVLFMVLTVDFQLQQLYREVRGAPAAPPRETPCGSRFLRVLERTYAVVFAPQDRLVRRFCRSRVAALTHDLEEDEHRRVECAYHDLLSVHVVANLGLSTQLALLGVLLAVGVPVVYLWFVLACGALVIVVFAARERRARAAVSS